MRIMKVLQIIADGAPGGGTTFVLDVLKSLDDPCLLTQEESYALEQGGKIPKSGIDFFTSRFDLRIPMKMQKVIDKMQPDIIHVHGGRAAFFLSFCKKPCPVLYTVHGLHGIHQGLKLSRFGEKKAMKGATLVNFVSHSEETLALQHHLLKGSNHCVIPHGINLNTLPPRREPVPKLIGFMGRLCPQKDPLFLLEIMNILGPKGYHLRVIGGGEYETILRKNPYTTVTGQISREKGLQLLSEVECIVVPSKWEAFGLVLLEAMGLEIPIIAAKIPPFEEVLAGGTYATLIKKKDPKIYASAILQGATYTQAAKKHLIEKFSWEQCMNSYHSIFRELKENSC